ncbi:MAG: alpha-L-arabinofuranosidase C-terminal domain-containing protein [Planctomycetota bacterium]
MPTLSRRAVLHTGLCAAVGTVLRASAEEEGKTMENEELFQHTKRDGLGQASLIVDAGVRGKHAISPLLYGKFCEHLGANIYNGMDAQILRNPTFGKWRFGAGESSIDGGVQGQCDQEKIARAIEHGAERFGLPDAAALLESYKEGAALWWFRLGPQNEVRLSPDAGPHGGRAQRVEVLNASAKEGRGIAQWACLPLHRTRKYVYRVVARADAPVSVALKIEEAGAFGPAVQLRRRSDDTVLELGREWRTFTGQMEVHGPTEDFYRLSLTSRTPANIVLGRVLLYPADHVDCADPDVIRMLKEARLPLLRWPGGNFVSGYRWRDGVGPVDERPTVPNPAWEGLEYNLFGTDEFIAFCRAVGCEPMICVNAGDGTAEEAAAWVAYCNSKPSTPLGALRAKNGHPEPYGVKLWEVGNEIYGRWQVSWTTSGGNVDRYQRFSAAMLESDDSIQLLACGAQGNPAAEWNQRLIAEAGPRLRCITEHLLNGVTVKAQTDPVDVFHAYMGQAVDMGRQCRKVRQSLVNAGRGKVRWAVTECQLFAHFQGDAPPGAKLTPQTLFNPATISEALYFTTLVHECIRLGDFVELFTHSATVNHGGGLRKTKERVWANPVHYAHSLGAAFFNAVPVSVKLASGVYSTANRYGCIPPLQDVPILDVMAALSDGGAALVLMLVHRGAACGPVALELELRGFKAAAEAEVAALAGDAAHSQNTEAEPERIKPRVAAARVEEGQKLALTLAPYSLTRVIFRKA